MILLIVMVIKLSKYQHRFWINKPVAFSSILPTRIGIIHSKYTQPRDTVHTDILPSEYHIQHIQDANTLHSKADSIITLWNTPEEHAHQNINTENIKKHISLQEVHSLLQQPHSELFLLMKDQTIIGTLLCSPTIMDTPIEHTQHVYIAQQLFIHPKYRKKRLAPCLMNYAIDTANARHQSEPVVLFSVPWKQHWYSQNRLPFAEVSKIMRVYHTYQPQLLLDPPTEVNHKIVKKMKDLPTRAFESSDLHISDNPTLELSTDTIDHKKYWQYILNQPQHIVLSIGGIDWIHLKHIRQQDTSKHSHEEEDAENTQEHLSKCVLILQGFSFHSNELDNIVAHMLQYMKTECIQEDSVSLVIQEPLASLFDEHSHFSKEPQHNKWMFYDAHYLYMYNYKLNQQNVHIPYTMHRDVLNTF